MTKIPKKNQFYLWQAFSHLLLHRKLSLYFLGCDTCEFSNFFFIYNSICFCYEKTCTNTDLVHRLVSTKCELFSTLDSLLMNGMVALGSSRRRWLKPIVQHQPRISRLNSQLITYYVSIKNGIYQFSFSYWPILLVLVIKIIHHTQ